MGDFPPWWLVPALIVSGWGVAAAVAWHLDKSGRRKNEMLRLIAQKHNCLADVRELCQKAWRYPPAVESPREKRDLLEIPIERDIEKLRRTYEELNELANCQTALRRMVELRRRATLDIEKLWADDADAAEMAEFCRERGEAAAALLEELEKIPPKPL